MPSLNEITVIVPLAIMGFGCIREGGCGNRDVADGVVGDDIDTEITSRNSLYYR
ncbi:MAG: hypothetical protein P8X92_02125 [Dehalococcoidia bacterium]